MHFMLDAGILNLTYSTVSALISSNGYFYIFLLMLLEAASFPVPSEIVLPALGYFAATGNIDLLLGFAVAVIGGTLGMVIDYYIAYFLGKEVVYKHLRFFHIKKEHLIAFDAWFADNGDFAVFVSRLLPAVRALINFPAGFAEMPIRKFLLYSIIGTVMWDAILVGFGYYVNSINNTYILTLAIAAFAVVLCIVYVVAMRKIRKQTATTSSR